MNAEQDNATSRNSQSSAADDICEPIAVRCCEEAGRTRLAAGQDPIKRRQILEGAQLVFMRMGFDAASMNDITREAGVSKGTIYVYLLPYVSIIGTPCLVSFSKK